MSQQYCNNCAKRSTCKKATHFENYSLDGCSDIVDKNKTCKYCVHFIGGGDWSLCCTESHDGYHFGFLCYEDTPACEKFSQKLNIDKLLDRVVKETSTEDALKDIEPF